MSRCRQRVRGRNQNPHPVFAKDAKTRMGHPEGGELEVEIKIPTLSRKNAKTRVGHPEGGELEVEIKIPILSSQKTRRQG